MSFILTFILIIKFIIESQVNPIVIFTDKNVINVQKINFPAVSVCPGLIYRIKTNITINYNLIKWKLMHRNFGIKNLTIDELKLMQVASLVAGDQFMSASFPNLSIPTYDLVEKLEDFQDIFGQPFYKTSIVPYNFVANWTERYPVFMTRTLWKIGFCYTFNFPSSSRIYNMDV